MTRLQRLKTRRCLGCKAQRLKIPRRGRIRRMPTLYPEFKSNLWLCCDLCNDEAHQYYKDLWGNVMY